MPGITADTKWLLGITLILLGAIGTWVRYETEDIRQYMAFEAERVLAQAREHANDRRAGRFTQEEFALAISFRDTSIDRLRDAVVDLNQTSASVDAVVTEYKAWVQDLAKRLRTAQQDRARDTGHISVLVGQVAAIEKALSEVQHKQDDVRETRIPNTRQLIESHIAQPHTGPETAPIHR